MEWKCPMQIRHQVIDLIDLIGLTGKSSLLGCISGLTDTFGTTGYQEDYQRLSG